MVLASDVDRVRELIHKIQVFAFPRRIRMTEFYVNFDNLRSGRCTRVQFGRGLDTAGVKIDDVDVEFLADYFTQDGPNVQKPQVVNYKAFCDAVEKVFNDVDLSFKSGQMEDDWGESPSSPISPGGYSGGAESMMKASMTSFIPKPVDDEDRISHIMHRLAALCKSRGICWKYLFHDFDRNLNPSPSRLTPARGGKCTRNQFHRLFPFKKEVSEDDIQYLMARYSTDGGDVHFQAIHNDISEVLSPEPPPFPTSPLVLKPDGTAWDHMTLNPVRKIQSKVVEKRVRLQEYFADFDPLRKGFCTAGQLKTVLTILNLEKEVDRNDFNHIVDAYSRDDGMFCHALFTRDIDAAFSVPGLEKEPLATTNLPDATTTAPGRRNRMSLSEAKKAKINHLEDVIRQRIKVRRILMKPMFQDMDKARKGLVTRNQFMRVMGMLGFELDPTQIALLAGYYCDRGNHNDFNYVDFIKACDPPVEEEEIAMSQLNAPYQDQAPSKYFIDGRKVRALDRAYSPAF
jgi:Ca2+-binding EF-hand superfamily protein